jgi:hypothetical protein
MGYAFSCAGADNLRRMYFSPQVLPEFTQPAQNNLPQLPEQFAQPTQNMHTLNV